MPMSSLAFILCSVALSALAQIAFKCGVVASTASAAPASPSLVSTLLTPGVIVGLALYGIGTLLWITALGQVQVSQAYPFVGLGFALTTLLGWWMLGDTLSTQRFLSIAVIIGGIILLSRS